MRLIAAAAAAMALSASALASAQTPDERTAARDLIKRRGDAVVMVTATLQIRANVGGQEQTVDQQAQANGVVLDASGLTVLSLSTLQPDDMMARSLSARMQPGTRVDVTSEPSEVQMHLADGREVAAKLVLRDQDLDLAFIKPTEPLAGQMVSVDAPAAKAALLDLLLVIQRTSETNAWATAATFATVQLVIDKPRLYYQIAASSLSGNGLGSPVFNATGGFVGLVVMRNTGSRGPAATGVLPAEDIREIALQAK